MDEVQATAAPAPSAPTAPATPVRSGLGLLLPLLWVGALVLVLAGTLAGGLRWLLSTEAGAAWLVQRLPATVQLEGFRGALLGPEWQAERLRVQWDGGRQWIVIEGLQGRGLRWALRPHAQAWLALDIDSLAARQVTLHTVTSPATGPTPMPATLAPPVQLQLGVLQVQSFVLDGQPPVNGLQLKGLQIDSRPGARHRVQAFALQAAGVDITGAAELANAPPYALAAQVTARPLLDGDAPAWAAVAQAQGNLADVVLTATLRGRPPSPPTAARTSAAKAALAQAPSVDFKATLQPLQPWPLASLDLTTQALNLAALLPQAPTTQINGQARLEGGAGATPLQAEVTLDNLLPGRWNEGRLPVRRLTLDMSGSLQQRDRIDLPRFEVQLADTGGSAGRYSGSAVWQDHTLTLDSQLEGVAPQKLDGRAATMTLTGPLALALRGLPSPDTQATTAAPPPAVTWNLDLKGQLAGAPQAVQLQLEGSADDQRLELKRATAQAGAAGASLTATLQRVARGEWQLKTTGSVHDFDPVPWWPGDAGGAWRQGPHRLSGAWQFDMRLPSGAETMKPLELAARLAGNGTLRLQDSQLAGVALAADVKLGYSPAASPAPATLNAEVQLGGNTLRLEGRGDPSGPGQSDRWQLALDGKRLAGLAALSRLIPDLAAWEPRGGSAQATLSADGRWPQMRSEGQATMSQLQLGVWSMASGSARWQLATVGGQALSMQVEASDIRQETRQDARQEARPGQGQGAGARSQRVQQLRADVSGTLAEHRIEISAALPVAPPRAAEQVLGLKLKTGTRVLLRAAGQWLPAEAGGGKWKARVDRLAVGAGDGISASIPASVPASTQANTPARSNAAANADADVNSWAEAVDLRAEVDFSAEGSLLALQASPGRLRLGDAFAVRWDEVRVDLRGAQPQLQMRANVEPFALAPLLDRLQPDLGWQGDLRVTARLDIRAAEKMDADLVIERSDGDLHLAGAEGTQLMGLSEFRLAITAHEGVWNFAPTLRGRSLGELSGRVTVQSTPERRWPQDEAAIAGEVRAVVADLGIWGAWVPPGWRLAGALETTAKVSGTFGKPQLDGQLSGQGLAVRNLLQGVNISDGQVLVKLDGDTAKIERFTLRAGDGSATITGGVTLGPKLQVAQGRLELKAERLRVLGRVDRTVIASGQAVALLQNDRLQLDGKFRIDEGRFDASSSDAPSLDDDVTVRRADTPDERQAAAELPPAKRSFVLGVDIDLGNNLRVRGRGLDTGLRGQLRLTTPGGRLAVTGVVSTDGGTYAAYGQKLEIERGIIAFSGAYDNPRLDVLALRPNIDQRVGVAITGNVLTPRVRLYAEPDLSDSEKLSWLVLGRAPDGLGRNDTALLQRAAVALLSGEGEAPTDALMRNLGIDEVSLRQGDGDVRETVITVGKQLSRRWYLGYERGVNATTGTWQLIYRIAQRFTLRAQSGEDSALDLIWTWRMQETPADAGMRKSVVTPP